MGPDKLELFQIANNLYIHLLHHLKLMINHKPKNQVLKILFI